MSDNNYRSEMSNYMISIHRGGVFEGTLLQFEKFWFTKPDNYTVDDYINFIRKHADKHGWEFEVAYIH